MSKILEFLQGKKTYIISLLMIVYGFIDAMPQIEQAAGILDILNEIIQASLAGGAFAALRAGLSKV